MPSTKRGRAPAPKLPRHWSEAKNGAEEAAWWDANSEPLMLQAAKRGQLKMGTLKQLMAEIEGNQPEETKLLSLRIAVAT